MRLGADSLQTLAYHCRHDYVRDYIDFYPHGLLCYCTDVEDRPRIVLPHDEKSKYRIFYEAHGTALRGHLGRERTYSSVSRHYWWHKLYEWVSTYLRTGEKCQRVTPSPHATASLASLPVRRGVKSH